MLNYYHGKLDCILSIKPEARNMVIDLSSDISSMMWVIEALDKGETRVGSVYVPGVNVILLTKNNNCAGWAWYFYDKSRRMISWLYVKEQYRRQGYGTILINNVKSIAKERHRALRVERWSKESTSFFDKLNIKDRWDDCI